MRPRDQHVGQLEVLAAVAAYTSRSEQLRDRDVIHFIDNTGAIFGIAKGYSADLDSARLISVFHTLNAALGANVWFEYVASAANIADLPSRGELDLLLSPQYGARRFDVSWPPTEAWEGDLTALFARFSPPSGRRRRKRGQ